MSSSPQPILHPQDQPDRNLVVLLLDVSGSMALADPSGHGTRISQLIRALDDFLAKGIHEDPSVPGSVNRLHINGEIAIGAFQKIGGVAQVHWLPLADKPVEGNSPFYYAQEVMGLTPGAREALTPNGGTPIGEAVEEALDVIERRKNSLFEDGLTHEFRPNLYLLTDGEATSSVAPAASRLHIEEAECRVLFWAFGTAECKEQDLLALGNAASDYDNLFFLNKLPLATVLKFLNKSLRHQATMEKNEPAAAVYDQMHDLLDEEMRPR